MADQLPVNFIIPSEGAIASYNFTDIAAGTGIVTYYLGRMVSPFFLTNIQQIYSDVYTQSTTLTGNGDFFDQDHDVFINRPITIKGDCYVNYATNVSASNGDIALTAKLRKWDGSTETEIASGTGGASSATGQRMMLAKITVSSATTIKKGEYLRLTILFTKTNHTGNSTLTLAYDPAGRTDANFSVIGTTSKLLLPVRIEI